MLTVTITTDAEGRITGICVPEGATAQVVPNAPGIEAWEARYGAEGEQFYRYDPDNDAGHRPHVPRYFRSRQYATVHELRPS